ncbi:uncharacterized protein LOC141620744 [Silene latifolia]|uniref:uncharacterized protein LOC141620744 n=1 Tax=Silene latifolia TaxID=37657 RepID=UPI003D773469
MDEFREAMDECGLMDIGISGEPFTWWSRRGGSEAVFERLDRARVSPSFQEACPTTTLSHLEYDKSDHAPMSLSMFSATNQKKGRRFRFEDMWANREDCEDVVRGAWLETTGRNLGLIAMYKLDLCSRRLAQWSKIQVGDLRRRIEEMRNRMNFLDSCSHDLATVVERKSMCAKLDELLIVEEVFWRQLSRVSFLTKGDKNTKFFYLRASNRKRRNHISRLKDEEGSWVTGEENLRSLAMEHFNRMFSSSNPNHMDEALSCVVPCVS